MENLFSKGLLQLQIECGRSPLTHQPCWSCEQNFKMADARVIACNSLGDRYGEICPGCISQGSQWLSNRLQLLTQANVRRQKDTGKTGQIAMIA